MSRLLKMEIHRLFKSNAVYICAIISAVFGMVYVSLQIINDPMHFAGLEPDDSLLFSSADGFILICTAAFTGIFVGAEHGGALRNKIIAGHERVCIYLSELIISIAAAMLFKLVNIVVSVITVFCCGGRFGAPLDSIVLHQLLLFAVQAGMSALFTMLAMLIPKKSSGTIAALIVIILFFASETFYFNTRRDNLRNEAYYYDGYIDTDGDGKLDQIKYRSPTAAEKAELAFLDAADVIFPFGQIYIINDSFWIEFEKFRNPHFEYHGHIPPLSSVIEGSLGLMCVSTLAGVLVFRKKDLK